MIHLQKIVSLFGSYKILWPALQCIIITSQFGLHIIVELAEAQRQWTTLSESQNSVVRYM